MIGTIANVTTIVLGSILGSLFKKGINPKYQDALYNAMGLAALGLGVNAVAGNLSDSIYPVLFIASLAIGSLLGSMIDLDKRFNSLVGKFSKTNIGEGLSTAIMLFCIGAFSILGPMRAALLQDYTYLFTNATLDFVTSFVLASTYGIGIIFSAVFLFVWQMSIYLFAVQLEPFLSGDLLTEIMIVGGFLIMASGLSILNIKKFKTMNILPALFIPPVWFVIMSLVG
ncbi:MAG: DUF554 domain-containing protein [Bacillota bacterium]